jgi:hypothetical protein
MTWQDIGQLIIIFVGSALVYELFDRAARK